MKHPYVITLLNGKSETILSIRDFEYLIYEYLGFEALKYFRYVCPQRQGDTYEHES